MSTRNQIPDVMLRYQAVSEHLHSFFTSIQLFTLHGGAYSFLMTMERCGNTTSVENATVLCFN